MGFTAYKACTKALIHHLEDHAVSTDTFEAVTIQDHSFTGLLKLVRGVGTDRDPIAIIRLVWFLIAASYVLIFPSFVSAMSGYSANVEAYIEIESKSLIPWDEFEFVRYTIHDGQRLGANFHKEYAVVLPGAKDSSWNNDWGDCSAYLGSSDSNSNDYELKDDATPACKLVWNVALYANASGYLGLNHSSSVFNHSGTLIDIEAPTLNISAYFTKAYKASTEDYGAAYAPASRSSLYANGFYWKNPETQNYTFGDRWNAMLQYDNKTYSGADINLQKLGRCQQTAVSYKWGFSFILLFTLLVSLLVWSLGIWTTYLHSFLHSRLEPADRHLGLQRATLDLADAMDRYVPKDDHDIASNSQLRKLVAGSQISYTHLIADPIPQTRAARLRQEWKAFRFKPWIRRDRWWFILSLLIFLMWVASIYPMPMLPPLVANTILLGGLLLMLFAGPESRSRWLIFCVSSTLFAILTGLACSGAAYYIFYVNPVHLAFYYSSVKGYVS